MPEIATLAARIAITGAQDAKAGLRELEAGLGSTAAATSATAATQETLSQRIAASVSASVSEINAIEAKSRVIASMSAQYIQAAANLSAWKDKFGEANVEFIKQEASLGQLAMAIKGETVELNRLQTEQERVRISQADYVAASRQLVDVEAVGTTAISAKEREIAVLATRYAEASARLREWVSANGDGNAQAVQQQANLDKMALGIQKETAALRDMQMPVNEVSGIGDAARKLFGELSGIFDLGGIGGMLTAGGGIAAIAMAGKAIVDLGNQTATSIAQIVNYAERAGMSSANFTRLAEAADDASIAGRGFGVEYAQVGSALENFQNQIGRGQLALDGFNVKGGASKAAFEALGVQLQDSTGKSREMTDILLDTAEAMQKMGDGAERTALAKRLGLYDLLPLLEKGRDGVREMMGAVDDSLVPTAEAEKAAIRLKEAEDNLDDSLRGIKTTIGTELIPVLSELTEKFNDQLKTSVSGFEALGNMFSSVGKGQDNYNRSVYDMVKALEGSTLISNAWYRELLRGTSAYQSAARAAEESASAVQGWADAYSEGMGRVSSATSALPKNEMGDWAAAWEDAVSRVDGRMTYIAAAGEDKLGKLKERVDAFFGALRQPLPEAATPRGKVEMAGDLISGKTTANQMGAELLSQAIGAAATKDNWQQLVEIQKQAKDGTLNYVSALQQVVALAPKMVDNKLAQNIKDYAEVLKTVGVDNPMVSFYADQVRQVQVFVKGTEQGAVDYAKSLAKIEEDQKRLARNVGAVATWNATKSWPADQTPAKMEAERLQIEAQIKKDEESLARFKRVKEGYWTTVTEFKPLPSFTDNAPSKGMVAHHDKLDPTVVDDAQLAGRKTVSYTAQAITDNANLIGDALNQAITAAYNWTQTPDYSTMWTRTGQEVDSALAKGIQQDGYRIRDAISNELTGIKAQLVRDVIDALKRNQ